MGEQFSLSVLLKLVDELSAPLNKVSDAFTKVHDKAMASTKGLREVGASMTKYVTIPLTALGVASLHSAAKFEDAALEFKHSFSGTADELSRLTKEFTAFAGTGAAVGVEAMLELGTAVSKGGVKDIEGVTKLMAKMGVLMPSLTGAEGVKNFFELTRAVGASEKEFGMHVAMLNAVHDNTNATGAEIAEMVRQLGQLTFTTEFTNQGLYTLGAFALSFGQSNGPVVTNTLQKMASIVGEMGPELGLLGERAGMTGGQFADMFKSHPEEAFMKWLKGMKEYKDKVGGFTGAKELAWLGLDSNKILGFLGKSANAAEVYARMQKIVHNELEHGGSIQKEYAEKMETLDTKWSNFGINLNKVSTVLGSVLAPAAKFILDVLNSLLATVAQMPAWMSATVVSVLALVATLGPLLILIGKIGPILAGIGGALPALSGLFIGFAKVIMSILSPLAKVMAVATAAYALGSYLNSLIDKGFGEKGGLGNWLYDTTHSSQAPGMMQTRNSTEVLIKLDKGLRAGGVNNKEGNAKVDVNNDAYMGQFAY
jgi:TP901 family phage tail tape measure protein